ncbi:unnamed protein product, partial [Ectocarpus sp. 13 AM-2016]
MTPTSILWHVSNSEKPSSNTSIHRGAAVHHRGTSSPLRKSHAYRRYSFAHAARSLYRLDLVFHASPQSSNTGAAKRDDGPRNGYRRATGRWITTSSAPASISPTPSFEPYGPTAVSKSRQ